MRDRPYEKILRDIRIFPIFEGANDVMRAFIALSGMKPVGREALGARRDRAGRPDPLDRGAGRLRRRPDPARGAPGADHHGPRRALGARRRGRRPGQGARLASPRSCCASTRRGSSSAQFQQKRLADAIADIYAQVAVLSRVTAIFEDQGVEPSGQERYIADTFCTRAAGRVRAQLRPDRVATTTSA